MYRKKYEHMNETRKYNEIKTIREKIRDLSLNLGDLMNILDNNSISEEFKKDTEHQSLKVG